MSEFIVARTLKAPHERVWQVLTLPGHFEGWLPAKPGTLTRVLKTVPSLFTATTDTGTTAAGAPNAGQPTRPRAPGYVGNAP